MIAHSINSTTPASPQHCASGVNLQHCCKARVAWAFCAGVGASTFSAVSIDATKPHAGALSNVVFGGPDLSTLYVTAGDRVYKREIKRKGVYSWAPVKPPLPRL